ncbi:MAG: hypothetical protein RLZZ121_864 [Bacteroidota bacterium]|jgi:DNA-binding CsgD family transcriptional regulator
MLLMAIKITLLSCLLVLVQTDGAVPAGATPFRADSSDPCGLPPLFFPGPAPSATQWGWKWTCQEHQNGLVPVRVARPTQLPSLDSLHLQKLEQWLRTPDQEARHPKVLAGVLISASVASVHEQWDWVGRCLDFLVNHGQPWPKSLENQAPVLEWLALRYEGARLQSLRSPEGRPLEDRGFLAHLRTRSTTNNGFQGHMAWDLTLAYERYHWSMLEGRPTDAMAYYREAQHFHSTMLADRLSGSKSPYDAQRGHGLPLWDYRLGLWFLVLFLAGAWYRTARGKSPREFVGKDLEDPQPGYAWDFSTTSPEELSRLRTLNVFTNADWESYKIEFEQNCPGYISWVLSRAPGMTQGELRTACMIRLGLTSREIARAQNIGVYGVAQSRYRLRKRLGLSTRVSIEEVLQPRGMG